MKHKLLDGLGWAADAVRKWAFVTLAVIIAFYVAVFIGGCTTTCAVIDVAHAGCAVLKYHDKLGNDREVRVTREDVEDFALSVASRRAGAIDGGVGDADVSQ